MGEKVIFRWQQDQIHRSLATKRVVYLTGARQVGKSTLVRRIARQIIDKQLGANPRARLYTLG